MEISPETLQKIEVNFHIVILGRVKHLLEKQSLDLPQLEFPNAVKNERRWFRVPGMYGGFSYWFEVDVGEVKLITESWSRVVSGSGQRHEVTVNGSKLIAEGFV